MWEARPRNPDWRVVKANYVCMYGNTLPIRQTAYNGIEYQINLLGSLPSLILNRPVRQENFSTGFYGPMQYPDRKCVSFWSIISVFLPTKQRPLITHTTMLNHLNIIALWDLEISSMIRLFQYLPVLAPRKI